MSQPKKESNYEENILCESMNLSDSVQIWHLHPFMIKLKI